MLIGEKERLSGELVELANKYGKNRSALLPILQAVMEKYHHISDVAMQEIADLLEIHPVEVYSVVTFYSFLKPERSGNFKIRLCKTISCDMQGKEKIKNVLENELGIKFGETTKDGRFSLEWVNCLGMCDQGPAMLVNYKVYTNLTAGKVKQIIDECRSEFTSHAVQKEG
ncbi:MAG: NADH-quinone oxidoreductase subunit NuoE [Acidobacteriota bacterium]|nr:NAD(P)H-dependent oxidoreductase subunit E [Thermoanaerobaculaceae bacterium]